MKKAFHAALAVLAASLIASECGAQMINLQGESENSRGYQEWRRAAAEERAEKQRQWDAWVRKRSLGTVRRDDNSNGSPVENGLYKELSRNPGNNAGRVVKFTGKVIQSLQDGLDFALRVDVTQGSYGMWKDTVYVDHRARAADNARILEGDVIRFRGKFVGIKSYQAVLGQTIQIPEVVACQISPPSVPLMPCADEARAAPHQ